MEATTTKYGHTQKSTEYVLVYGESGRERCDTAFDYLESKIKAGITSKTIILLAAGKSLRRPEDPPLSQQMSGYLKRRIGNSQYLQQGRNPNLVTVQTLEKDCWGTFEETVSVNNFLKESGITELTLISGSSHLPRIYVIWKLVNPTIQLTKIPYVENVGSKTIWTERIKTLETYFFGVYYKVFGEQAFDKLSERKNILFNS